MLRIVPIVMKHMRRGQSGHPRLMERVSIAIEYVVCRCLSKPPAAVEIRSDTNSASGEVHESESVFAATSNDFLSAMMILSLNQPPPSGPEFGILSKASRGARNTEILGCHHYNVTHSDETGHLSRRRLYLRSSHRTGRQSSFGCYYLPVMTLTIYSAQPRIDGQSRVEGRPGYARMWIRDRGRRDIAESAQHNMIQDLQGLLPAGKWCQRIRYACCPRQWSI
jgi:hypothetical protein